MLLELFQIQAPSNTGGSLRGNAQEALVFPIPLGTCRAPRPPPRPLLPRDSAPQKHPGLTSWAPYCSFIDHMLLLVVSKEQNFRISILNFSNIQSYPDILIHLW